MTATTGGRDGRSGLQVAYKGVRGEERISRKHRKTRKSEAKNLVLPRLP